MKNIKKTLMAVVSVLVTGFSYSQTLPTVLDNTPIGYVTLLRIGTNYIAALREETLDIRYATNKSLGILDTSISLSDIPVMAGLLEKKDNVLYTIGNNLTPIDISNPSSPIVGIPITLQDLAIGSLIWNDFLIISCENEYTYIFDIALSSTPVLLDSINTTMSEIYSKANILYTRKYYGYYIYSWDITAIPPYLALRDSFNFSSPSISFTIVINQLIAKNIDSLYRFDLSAASDFQPLSVEALPAHPGSGSVVAIDTNYIGYAKYNSFSLSYGNTGNSFMDSLLLVFPNYILGYGKLDNCIFYGDMTVTRLIGFNNTLGINETPENFIEMVYPNPTNDNVFIHTIHPGKYNYILMDITGNALVSGSFENMDKTLSLKTLSSGIYFLQLQNDKHQKLIKKIIKQ